MVPQAEPAGASGWRYCRFGEIAAFAAGRTPPRDVARYWAEAPAAGVPWVAIGDMVPHRVVEATRERITDAAVAEVFKTRLVPKGTLLMSFKLTIGRVATLGVDACHNEAIIAVYPLEGVHQRYLSYALSCIDYTQYQDRAIKGHTLNREKLERVEILLPPYDEQAHIARALDLVQRAVQVEETLIAATCELKQAAMEQLFTRGLRGEEQVETSVGLVPKSWRPAEIGELGDVVTGTTPRTAERRYYEGGSVPFIAPGDLGAASWVTQTEKCMTEAGLAVSRALPRGAVCFVCIGSSIGKVGITTAERSATNQQINAVVVSKAHDPTYVFYLLSVNAKHVATFASPSPVPILSKGVFERIGLFVSPDIEEQQRIAAALAAIDRTAEVHERKRSLLSELFETLLHDLMTGRVRAPEIAAEVEAVTA